MPQFIAERVFKLDFLGEGWKDCFIKFSAISIKESRELLQLKLTGKTSLEITDMTVKFFQDHFLSGNAYDAETKKIIALTKETIELLPSLIQEKAILFLAGDANQQTSTKLE